MADDRIEIEIVLDDGTVRKGFQRVSSEGAKSSRRLSETFGNTFAALRRSVLQLGAVFAGVFAGRAVVTSLTGFQTALAEVDTITNNLSKSNRNLADSLINVSSQFGTTAAEQAKSFYQIVSAGITDSVQASEALVSANKLAIGGLTSTETAVDLLTSTLNAFKSTGLTSARAADVLFGTVRLGKTRIDLLASSIGQLLPTAEALGISFEDANAAVAQLTTTGISTSEAVTRVNAILTAVLRNQKRARDISKEVGDAFSLQSLEAKGLTLFLKDLNNALGGSKERLQELIGRAEGTRGIIALASDDFVGMADKVRQLEQSTGAADAAFKRMNETLDRQTAKLFAQISNIILKLTRGTGGDLTDLLISVNDSLESLTKNTREFSLQLQTLAIRIVGFAVFIKREAIFAFISRGIAGASLGLKAFASEMKVFQAVLVGTTTKTRAFAISLASTTVALKAMTLSIRIFKGVATFGILLVLDEIIIRFLKAKDGIDALSGAMSGTPAEVFSAKLGALNSRSQTLLTTIGKLEAELFELNQQIGDDKPSLAQATSLLNISLALEKNNKDYIATRKSLTALRVAERDRIAELKKAGDVGIPGVPSRAEFSSTLGGNLQFQAALLAATSERIQAEQLLLTKSSEDRLKAAALFGEQTILVQQQFDLRQQELRKQFLSGQLATEEEFNQLSAQLVAKRDAQLVELSNKAADALDASRERTRKLTAEISGIITAGITRAISQSIQAVIGALKTGENALGALKTVILNTFGDILIRMGEAMILTGEAIEVLRASILGFFGGQAIAAGIALVALGSVLKGAAGGTTGSSIQGGGVGGGDLADLPGDQANIVEDIAEPGTAVNINVEGTVLDPRGVGLQIANILEDTFRSNGVKVVTA